MQHDVQTSIHHRWLRCAPIAVAAATPRSRALPAARLDAWAAALHLGSNS
ncbi:MAG: hypothetical protein JRS35_22620 [Deltaproteobacteria bacterium]|nr:hypothetical protein [Deltaproteobacteria bacterium]